MRRMVLPLLILIMGTLYIFFIPGEPMLIKLLFKLIPMWLIIIYAFTRLNYVKERYQRLLLVGLFFCMIGDGTLHWFVFGLSMFLIGHIFYFLGFLRKWKLSVLRFASIIPIGAFAYLMSGKLIESLIDKSNDELIIPVIAYVAIISLMTFAAFMTGNKWAILGSIFFMFSDTVLAWNKFITDITYSGPIIMISYYLAQYLIAHSISDLAASSRQSYNSYTYRY